jgi:N-acetylmuramoyl-L-alanine amidase
MEIKQKFIPKGNTKTRPGIAMDPTYITVHTTANTSAGADAAAHARLQLSGNNRTASWHYTTDDHEIYQSVPDNEVAWHAGDGGSGTGNRKSIAVEICVNSNGNFEKAKSNAVWLIRLLMAKHNIPISRVVPHKHWSGKDCPHEIIPHWDSFINQIKSTSGSGESMAEDMYDLSYLKDGELVGLMSSKHPSEINQKVSWAMNANANCVLLLKRGFDLRQLKKALDEMYPE